MSKNKNHLVYQFRISLREIEPEIWRRIQVPAKYNFWDLHVAVQDAMGWLDTHLHAFLVRPISGRKLLQIGIPDDEFGGDKILPGWEFPLIDHFIEPGQSAKYDYDFGDGWEHEVLLEAVLLEEKDAIYPRCIGGARACPPEDCGGVPGYYNLLEIMRDPSHPEYRDHIAWLSGDDENDHPYDPEAFDPVAVHFDNPKKRWKHAFS